MQRPIYKFSLEKDLISCKFAINDNHYNKVVYPSLKLCTVKEFWPYLISRIDFAPEFQQKTLLQDVK